MTIQSQRDHAPTIGRVLAAAALLHVLFLSATVRADPSAVESSGWLNAKDFGASGSTFQTTAAVSDGSKQITVAEVGDFKVGQGVTVSGACVRFTKGIVRAPRTGAESKLGDAVELRGYDGSHNGWLVFLVEIDGVAPLSFRWTDDFRHPFTWKAEKVSISDQWHNLSAGVEARFIRRDWKLGNLISFHARDALVTRIEKVEGKVLTLRDPANRTAVGAMVRHKDTEALQAALDQALRAKCNLLIPPGHYRLERELRLADASAITVAGAAAGIALLDISDGEGPCLQVSGGTEVTLRNLHMVGHGGLANQAGNFVKLGDFPFWPMHLRGCSAVAMGGGTDRMLIENCHASKMTFECFYAQGPSRSGHKEPKHYARSLTYLRCSVTDCGFNAFNNNDLAENTSVLQCRIQDVGNCAWEGASRFSRFIGNYVRNANSVAGANIHDRSPTSDLMVLGSGQAIIADNVFEQGTGPIGGYGIVAQRAATQVVIRNNLFINYNSRAIGVLGPTAAVSFPAAGVIVTGNIIDMTSVEATSNRRCGIEVSASDAIVSDNQVYVRGPCDPRVTGIWIQEPALNVQVHGNLVRNCGQGLVTGRARSRVGQVLDPTCLVPDGETLRTAWPDSHLYRGWSMVLLPSGGALGPVPIEAWDPHRLCFKLREPCAMKPGDRFEVYPPAANWNIHGNTITGCLRPVMLDCYGSATSLVKDNLIARGGAAGVKAAIELRGMFKLIGNHVSGFDEKDSAALSLLADPFGRTARSTFRDNIFQGCARVVPELQRGLWDEASDRANVTTK